MLLHVKIPVLLENIRILLLHRTLYVLLVTVSVLYVRDLQILNAVNVHLEIIWKVLLVAPLVLIQNGETLIVEIPFALPVMLAVYGAAPLLHNVQNVMYQEVKSCIRINVWPVVLLAYIVIKLS